MTLDLKEAEPSTVKLAELRIEPELLCRASGLNKDAIEDYAELYGTTPTVFPAVVVFLDPQGVHWLADGFHRAAGAERAGLTELPADVRKGGKREALLFAVQANQSHGLRRTNADKRRGVELVLHSFAKWSDRKVAAAVGVSHTFVAEVRRGQVATVANPPAGDDASGSAPAPDVDKLATRLTSAITKALAALPAEAKAKLRDAILAALTE